MTTEEIRQPPFGYQDPGRPLLAVAEIAARLAEPGLPAEIIAGQVRRFALRGLIHPRDIKGSGRTAHNLFGLAEVATAKILSDVTDMGVADIPVLEAVSLACYSGIASLNQPDTTPFPHPVQAAMHGLRQGRDWSLTVDFWRHTQTGDRRVTAALVPFEQMAAGRTPRPLDVAEVKGKTWKPGKPLDESGWLHKGSILLQLAAPLTRALRDPSKGN